MRNDLGLIKVYYLTLVDKYYCLLPIKYQV